MRRSKAGTLRAIAEQEMNSGYQGRVIAGPQPHDMILDHVAAHEIGKDDHYGGKRDPLPFIFFKIHQDKGQQENIQRYPGDGIPDDRHQPVKEIVMEMIVNISEQGPVRLDDLMHMVLKCK